MGREEQDLFKEMEVLHCGRKVEEEAKKGQEVIPGPKTPLGLGTPCEGTREPWKGFKQENNTIGFATWKDDSGKAVGKRHSHILLVRCTTQNL